MDALLDELLSLPQGSCDLRAPCPDERIRQAETRFGLLPHCVVGLLRRFNGASLLIDAIALVTIFGLSAPEDDPDSDWFIDRYTPKWRSRMGRTHDLVIGMFNYGGLITIGSDSVVREWDSAQGKWSSDRDAMRFDSWLVMISAEGREYLADLP